MDNPEHLEIVKEKYGEAYWDELVATYMSDEDPHGADEPETTANADG
jgi:FPC/CPF motif-containing protein YcgG